MTKLLKKLALAMVPVVIYFAIFIYFEPYNYFGLKHNEYVSDSAIVRVREFNKAPADILILGDSRMAHFDIDLVESIVGEDVGQVTGVVKSVLFKGVHYEMMIDAGHSTWKVHSTSMQPVGSKVGLSVVPFNIHIMNPMKEEKAE